MARKKARRKARPKKASKVTLLQRKVRDLSAQLRNVSKAHGALLESHDNLVDQLNGN